jgi:antitoxin PrlF
VKERLCLEWVSTYVSTLALDLYVRMYYHDSMGHFTQSPKKNSRKRTGTEQPGTEHRLITEPVADRPATFRGKRTQTGNSLALRFDRALFKSHPEFSGEVQAWVIAPGRMLVVAEMPTPSLKEDPVMASFLSFLAQDMERNPHRIEPLNAALMARVEKLTRGMKARFDEPLGDEELL